ncbi:T-complex 10 C-terminal domain-containing protein, partial [Streptomyces sp. PSKA30]|uniref:T-complex 10 C-terminal domain-containing protein n=1 Tax=Streptomyces sp. PSKA30 TaxID=2874597 RepID=UPI001CD125B8
PLASWTRAHGEAIADRLLDGLLVNLVVLTADPLVAPTGASPSVDTNGTVEIRFPDGTRERVPPLSGPPVSPPAPAPGGTS